MTYRIQRDDHGIPHVSADSIDALFEGQGYATAQDRMWQLEVDRRRAAGTLAEVTGHAGHGVADAFARRARLVDHARAGFDRFDDETRRICDAHARGVNTWLTVNPEIDGLRPAPFEGWECVSTFLVRHVTFSTWQTKLWNARVLAALGPDALPQFRREGAGSDVPLIVPPGVHEATGALIDAGLFDPGCAAVGELEPLGLQMSGSNSWVVAGSRTRFGRPLIAGDPHRAFESPNVYFQIGLRCDAAGIDGAGFSFPGVPGVPHFAQTQHVAWAVTNASADYQDLFVERLPSAHTDCRTEVVLVKDGDPIEVECGITRHGPVVVGSSVHGVGIALSSAGLTEAGRSLRCVLPQLRAMSLDALDAAHADWVEPSNNVVMASAEGDIGYRTTGWIPVRTSVNSWLPVPGWTDAHDRNGYIPDAELPRSRNPSAAAIVTANQRVTTRGYPHYLGHDVHSPHRAERIWVRLGDRTDLDVTDMSAMHTDTISIAAQAWLDLLPGWDGSMQASSTDAARYAQARHELVKTVTARLPPALRENPFAAWEPPATASPAAQRVSDALDNWIAADDRMFLADGQSWTTAMQLALDSANAIVGERTWGDLHHFQALRLGGRDRLDLGPVSGGGDCVMATIQLGGITTNALVGSTARYVWDLGDRRRSGWIVPLGAADGATDQFEHWRRGGLLPVFED